MSWSVADASLALFHHAFDYPVKTEGETLEHIGTYAGPLPFMADSQGQGQGQVQVRPDGYGLLDQQMLQMSMPTSKYSRFSNNLEAPPYVDHFLVRAQSDCLRRTWLVILFIKLSVSSAPNTLPPRTPTICLGPALVALFLLQPFPPFAKLLAFGRYRLFIGTKAVGIACIVPTVMVRGSSHESHAEVYWHSFPIHALAALQLPPWCHTDRKAHGDLLSRQPRRPFCVSTPSLADR